MSPDQPPGSVGNTENPRESDFARACTQTVRLLTLQQSEELVLADEAALSEALNKIIRTLPRLLASRVADRQNDVDDIAQEALTRFMAAISRGQVHVDASPAGYLLTIAVNVIRDKLRQHPLPMPANDFVLQERSTADSLEGVAKLLDELASVETIKSAIRRAAANGDSIALDVVAAWLDLAARNATAPTTRDVAAVLGIGKSTVSNVLQRFTNYIRSDN